MTRDLHSDVADGRGRMEGGGGGGDDGDGGDAVCGRFPHTDYGEPCIFRCRGGLGRKRGATLISMYIYIHMFFTIVRYSPENAITGPLIISHSLSVSHTAGMFASHSLAGRYLFVLAWLRYCAQIRDCRGGGRAVQFYWTRRFAHRMFDARNARDLNVDYSFVGREPITGRKMQ